MKQFIRIAAALALVVALAGCTTASVSKIQSWSANYQASIAAINADIAATSPTIAKVCGDLQTVAMLIAPYVPSSGKAQQYFDAANGALTGYCQAVPTDIKSTASALARAYSSARAGYDQIK